MKRIHIILEIIIILSMLSANVFAEDTQVLTYKAHVENNQITVTEDELISDIDNSALNVRVVKRSGETETLMYTGPLGGYENGVYSFCDFNEIQFLVIFDWDTMENETIYIIPIDDSDMSSTVSQNNRVSSNKKQSRRLMGDANPISISSQIKINGVNVGENGIRIIKDANLNCNFTMTNNSLVSQKISAILATYTEDQRLYQVRIMETPYIEPGNTESIQILYRFNAEQEHTGKIFFWNNGMMPIRATIDFTQNSGVNAYYYNADNRLLQIDKANNTSVYFTYDNMGNLISKTVGGDE